MTNQSPELLAPGPEEHPPRRCIQNMINRFLHEEEGQTLVEYGLLISLIALVLIAVLTLLGKRVYNTFNSAANAITSS